MRHLPWLILLSNTILAPSSFAQDPPKNLGFQVPEGFEVSLYADDSLASDIHSLTIDSHGRVVVASKGYIKILHDTKGTGKADKATLFADFPKSGAHGMYFDGNDLICNGDKGVRRLYDTKGVGKCDKVSDVWFPTKNDGEHSANGIMRGPDGWYYMICGNDAGITKAHANGPRSPVKDPQAGAIVRFSPDGKTQEVVAHGFRNPYDLAFNHLGNLFTVDADGERVYHMPYYAPTRLFDVASGMHHGWLGSGWRGSWSRPACWPDNVERMVEIGRGSPTGLLVYRHRAFPERYRNGVFSLCWTFGRLYFFPLERDGSTYKSKMEVFMKTTGDVGFAPTDMAVGPDGDLFIAIGGRGTRGSVFKVSYKGKNKPSRDRKGAALDAARTVLSADEPLSSWSRARWVLEAKKLGKDAFTTALMKTELPLEERIRAVEILTELFGGVPEEQAQKICQDKGISNPDLQSRVVWSLSRSTDAKSAWRIIAGMTHSTDARPTRAAWEALLAVPQPVEFADLDLGAGLKSRDRRVRAIAIAVATKATEKSFLRRIDQLQFESPRVKLAYLWYYLAEAFSSVQMPDKGRAFPEAFFGHCVDVCTANHDSSIRMEAARLLQLALGDVLIEEGPNKAFWGYQARNVAKRDPGLRRDTSKALAKAFPTGDVQLDLELARLLAMLHEDVPGLPAKIANRWTKDTSVESDIHYLLVLSQLPGKRDKAVTLNTAAALNGIQVKLAALGAKPSDQVPAILESLLERLIELDPALPAALVADAGFGNPGHALYANKLPLPQKQAAARKLLAAIGKLDAEQAQLAWEPELVHLTAALPDEEALPILRARFADPRLTDTVAVLLCAKRQAVDRPRFIEALGSMQPNVMGTAAEALVSLTPEKGKGTPAEIGKAIRALRRLEGHKTEIKPRAAVVQLLTLWTGQDLPAGKDGPAAAWSAWFTNTYPKEAALAGPAGTDFAAWKKRLDRIDWEKGDARRGAIVFQRRTCFACHGESRRLGPDLTGIGQRFYRDDLFTAIVDPSKDISPAYVATTISTKGGKIYNGMMIYTSDQLYLLQTAADTTVRIAGEDVLTVQPGRISFMPTGLLDDARDGDLADLYAYLKALRKK